MLSRKRIISYKPSKEYKLLYPVSAFIFACIAAIGCGYGFSNNIYYILTSFILLLMCKNKFWHGALIVFLSILPAIYSPAYLVYGGVNKDIVAAFIFTNETESKEFISVLPFYGYMASLIIIIVAVTTMKVKKNNYIPIKARYKFLFFIAVLTIPEIIHEFKKPEEPFRYSRIPTIRFIYDWFNYSNGVFKDIEFINKFSKAESDWTPTLTDKPVDNIVVIIGESVRKDKMSAYGFADIDSTPFMSTSVGTLFTSYTSIAGSTAPSLKRTLFNVEYKDGKEDIQYNNSIIKLYKKVGYDVNWISNQGLTGPYDNPMTITAKESDSVYFLQTQSGVKSSLDKEMLPKIFKSINDERPTATFVHLRGSHSNACERVDDKYDIYYRSERVSCYIQSLKNTDSLISAIVDKLKSTKGSWKLIYFGDHGQGLYGRGTDNENYAHNPRSQEGYETALFTVTSDDKERKIVNYSRTGYDVLPMLVAFGNIKDPLITNTCDLFNDMPCDSNSEVYVVHDDKRLLFSSLPREKY